MSSHRISHIALHVESLRQAATFYARLFDLEVLAGVGIREDDEPDPSSAPGRRQIGEDAPCDEYLLGRGDFRLLLKGDAVEPAINGRLAHICLRVGLPHLGGLRRRASSASSDSIATRSAPASSGGTSLPVSPSCTISPMLPTGVVTTASPQDMACMSACGTPSLA